MSVVRWSSICEDNYESDLYIYGGYEGTVVHIAAARMAGIEKAPRLPKPKNTGEMVENAIARMGWRRENEHKFVRTAIDLPYAGESKVFADDDVDGLLGFVRELKELGYHMPDYVLERDTYDD